jgi:hypothetical protein
VLLVLLILVECFQYFNFLFGVVLHSNDILSVIFLEVLNVRLILQQRVEHAIIDLSLMRNHPPAYDNQLIKVWGGSHRVMVVEKFILLFLFFLFLQDLDG